MSLVYYLIIYIEIENPLIRTTLNSSRNIELGRKQRYRIIMDAFHYVTLISAYSCFPCFRVTSLFILRFSYEFKRLTLTKNKAFIMLYCILHGYLTLIVY